MSQQSWSLPAKSELQRNILSGSLISVDLHCRDSCFIGETIPSVMSVLQGLYRTFKQMGDCNRLSFVHLPLRLFYRMYIGSILHRGCRGRLGLAVWASLPCIIFSEVVFLAMYDAAALVWWGSYSLIVQWASTGHVTIKMKWDTVRQKTAHLTCNAVVMHC